MDMTPPQAPPAVVSSAQQEAIDGLGRLVAVQSWLRAQQQALPALPTRPASEGRDAWFTSLDLFWQQPVQGAPGAVPMPRIDGLATRLASTMRDDAIVRRFDGTLDLAAARLAERFARSPGGGDLPPGLEARSLRVGTVDYAGAVVVLDHNDPTLVLRFLPDRGWDAFDSLDRLHTETEVLWRQQLARQRELPGVPADDTAQVVANDRFVDSRPLQADVFQAMARRIAAVQRQKVEDAWPDDEAAAPSQFTDDATSALDLHDKLDIFAILVEREDRLAGVLDEQRLARVPADVAQSWRDAVEGYRLARLLAASSARQHVEGAPLTLAAWSRRELVAALARRRITLDPDDILLEVSGNEGFELPTIIAPTGTNRAQAAAPTRMSLAEFALRNTGTYDGRQLRVSTDGLPTGSAPPALHVLREIARELDLAPRFDTYLRQQASDPHGRAFRHTAMRLQQARMRVEAVAARMTTYLDDETTVFTDDRQERGYRMVEAVLNSPAAANRSTVGGHRITVRQLVYRGAVVSDVLVIGVRDERSSSRVVLYTPGAPDGRPFREFSDRATASREFLYAPAFQEYLLRRLPIEYGESIPNGSGRRFRVSDATRQTRWVLTAPGEGRGTITEERFEDRVIDGDIRTALFDAEIVRQARDVGWLGRSTAEADVEALIGILNVVSSRLRGPGTLVEETLGAVGQALRATWRFYDSVKAGDSAQAFVDFTEAYTASLGLAGWRIGASRAVQQRLSLRAGGTASRRIDAGIRLPDARQWLDPSYAVRGIDLHGIRPDALGIHRVNGRRYIRQQDAVFELRRDASNGTWRLTRPNPLDATFSGPAVEPVPAGGWRSRMGIGLRGGWVDDAAFPQARSRGIDGTALDSLSDFQRWSLQQSLAARLNNGAEASRIYWEVSSQPRPLFVTLRQRTAWNDALRTARGTPREPLTVGSLPEPGATWRVLPPNEWPTYLWHYPSGLAGGLGGDGARVLPLQALPGTGLVGLPATTQAPAGARGPAWIRLRLDRFRHRLGTAQSPGIRILEDRRGAERTYTIQPSVGFPIGFLGLEPGDFTASGWVSP